MNEILYVLYAVLAIAVFRLTSQIALSISYNLKRKNMIPNRTLRISVIVPAFNEEKTIRPCILSLQNLNYPNYELIVVDDGSTDRTLEEISKIEGIKLIHQSNQGKPEALNTGIRNSSGEVVLTVDADTTLDKQALAELAARFERDERLGAVAGNVKVKTESTLLNALQSAEYATGINLIRKGQSVLGCVMIVPGPVAALRRDAVEKAGFFSKETFAEDFDITLMILKAGFKAEYEEKSIAYTDAPKSVEDLIKQRRRWYRGMTQVLDKHKDMYFNKRFGSAGLFGVPNLWFDSFSPFLNLALLLISVLTWLLTGEIYSSLAGILLYLIVALGTGIIGLSLEPKPEKRNYLVLPLLLFYNTFLDGIRIMSFTEEMTSIMMEWEKPKR